MLRGNFVLSSGGTSDVYVDARRVTLSGEGGRLVGAVVLDMLSGSKVDGVAGMTLGADPVVTAVAVMSACQVKPLDGLLVRKEAKEHGASKRVEGPLRPGMRVAVVEDTATTGRSALEAVAALREAGVTVESVITLIDREEGARQAVEASGLAFSTVFSIGEVLRPWAPGKAAQAPRTSSKGAFAGRRMLLHTDGAAVGNPGPAGAGFVLYDPSGEVERGSRPLGRATNNVAEYEALVLGLEAAHAHGVTDLTVRMDSELVVKQMNGVYRTKHPDLQPLNRRAKALASGFERARFEYVPRERNRVADGLATSASKKTEAKP